MAAADGLIGASKSSPRTRRYHSLSLSCIIFMHAPEEGTEGKKRTKSEEGGAFSWIEQIRRAYLATRQKCGTELALRASLPLYISSFFSTANSPHVSRGSWARVCKGAGVLEMMASAARKKGRSATCIAEGYARITLFIPPSLCPLPRLLPLLPLRPPGGRSPFFSSQGKRTLASFSSLLLNRVALPLLSLPLPLRQLLVLLFLLREYPRYINGVSPP